MKIHSVHSLHDGGWYCEVYDSEGVTVFTTAVHPNRTAAVAEARQWIAATTATHAEGEHD